MWSKSDYIVLFGFIFLVYGIFFAYLTDFRQELKEDEKKYEQRLEKEAERKEEQEKLTYEMDKLYHPTEFKIGETIFESENTSFRLKGVSITEVIIEAKSDDTYENIYPSHMKSFFELGDTKMFAKIKEVDHSKGTVVFYFTGSEQ